MKLKNKINQENNIRNSDQKNKRPDMIDEKN
jgi:hypothetical protein